MQSSPQMHPPQPTGGRSVGERRGRNFAANILIVAALRGTKSEGRFM